MSRPPSTLWQSFGWAWAGFRYLLRTQRNMRIHTLAVPVVAACGWWMELSRVEWAVLALAAGLVMAAEALNTSIEAVVDLLSPEWQEQARIAKEAAAAGVLMAAFAAAVAGVLIFGGRLAG